MAKDAESRMAAPGDGTLRNVVAKTTHRRASVALAVCGEPVVGRALVLLLRGARYDSRFVSVSTSGEVASLGGVRLLLLAPTPGLSPERREALLAALGEATAVAGIPILELVPPPKRARARQAQMSWPCSAEQLERRIEAILLARPYEGDRREDSRASSPGERRSA